MADYTLYYWPLPFRGQFVRAVLAHLGASWDEADSETILALKDTAPSEQHLPHMGQVLFRRRGILERQNSLGVGLIPTGTKMRQHRTHELSPEGERPVVERVVSHGDQGARQYMAWSSSSG